jgi:hypothetical protein
MKFPRESSRISSGSCSAAASRPAGTVRSLGDNSASVPNNTETPQRFGSPLNSFERVASQCELARWKKLYATWRERSGRRFREVVAAAGVSSFSVTSRHMVSYDAPGRFPHPTDHGARPQRFRGVRWLIGARYHLLYAPGRRSRVSGVVPSPLAATRDPTSMRVRCGANVSLSAAEPRRHQSGPRTALGGGKASLIPFA